MISVYGHTGIVGRELVKKLQLGGENVQLCDRDETNPQGGIVVLSTAPEISIQHLRKIIQTGTRRIVDMSGALRLTPNQAQEVYGVDICDISGSPNNQIIYGLQPWVNNTVIDCEKTTIITNPGCFATALLHGLVPLADQKRVSNIHIEGHTGYSATSSKYHETWRSQPDGVYPRHNASKMHPHVPEIRRAIHNITGVDFPLTNFPTFIHVPIFRGMRGDITCTVGEDFDLGLHFQRAYTQMPHVQIVANIDGTLPSIESANHIDGVVIYVHQNGEVGRLSVVIDNLLRGGASQALENIKLLQTTSS